MALPRLCRGSFGVGFGCRGWCCLGVFDLMAMAPSRCTSLQRLRLCSRAGDAVLSCHGVACDGALLWLSVDALGYRLER